MIPDEPLVEPTMSDVGVVPRAEDLEPHSDWSPAVRAAFRFFFVYFSLYIVFAQMLSTLILIPNVDLPELGTLPPTRGVVSWMAKHVFGVGSELVVTGSGSGDKIFDWVEVACLLGMALAGAVLWSWLGRRQREHRRLDKWFRVVARFALGSTMLVYGFDKLIPVQMPFPNLARLVEPFGNFSPMGVLWSSIGASPAYESFLGGAEVLSGILVLLPRTALLGTLLCLADAIQVFVFNMTYDVPVKLFSFHMILLGAFLLAPEARRLWSFFMLDRAAEPSSATALFQTPRANQAAAAAQLLFAAYLAGVSLYAAQKSWNEYGGGAPRSPLYGIWNVEQMSVDGDLRPPLLTDQGRWRRFLFQVSERGVLQRMDDSFVYYKASIDTVARKLSLTRVNGPGPEARFTFERPSAERLVLDGDMDGHKVRFQLTAVDPRTFLLVSRGFHWIQEFPFNR